MKRLLSQGFAKDLVECHSPVLTRTEIFKPELQILANLLVRAWVSFQTLDQQSCQSRSFGHRK